jgi:GT2 family glycosyltransferase
MKNKIRVAIIIPTSNRPHDICCLLDNLLFNQDYPDWLEPKIYVIDNGKSTDHIAISRNFNDYILSSKIIVRYIGKQLGSTHAFTTGMNIAFEDKNDILILVDNDAYPLSRDLIKSLAEVIVTKKADATMPINVISADSINEANYNNSYVAAFHFFAISREVYSQIGLPDNSFYMYCDDAEYRGRIHKNGFNFLVLNNKFYIHNSNSSGDLRYHFTYGLRNWYCVQSNYGLNYSLFYSVFSFSIYSIYFGLRNLYILVQGMRSLKTKGKIELFFKKVNIRKATLTEVEDLPKDYIYLTRSDFLKDLLFEKIPGGGKHYRCHHWRLWLVVRPLL